MRSHWIHSLVASILVKRSLYRRLHRREILRWVEPVIYDK
ncbi:unnamed protein product [Brassica oleracea var. botrytis]